MISLAKTQETAPLGNRTLPALPSMAFFFALTADRNQSHKESKGNSAEVRGN